MSDGLDAKMLAESVHGMIAHMESTPGGQVMDDASKAAIFKSAAHVYEMKYQREAVVAAFVKNLS
jgi:hypothetical protein